MLYIFARKAKTIDMNSLRKKTITLFTLLLFAFTVFSQTQVDNQSSDKNIFKNLKYRNVGPTRGGRVTTVAGVFSQPATFYMGSTGGGVWKTQDYGINWFNISDGYFSTPSIGAIQVAQNNPDIIYVGTGSDGLRSNVIAGKGIYKSINAGKSWEYIGLDKVGQIGAVEIHPDDENIIFVAAIGQAFNPNKERGVYKTIDGGETWKLVLYLADTLGAVDLELAPDNPNIIYAAMWRAERKPWTIISGGKAGGIYKSENGGENWKKLENGLPQGVIGKIDLAVSKADPDRLYALVEALEGEGLYRSNNRGESFELVSQNSRLLDRPFYYCNIEANPLNANVLYVNSTGFYKSVDAGKSWKRKSTPHGDNHDIWINENDTLIMLQANDGGANVTMNGGDSWSSQRNQPTAELYQVEVDDQYPYWLYAGQQDNSTIAVPSLPPYSSISGGENYWREVGGCETGPAVPKPGNPNIVYSNCKGHFGVYNKLTGQERSYTANASNIYGHNPKDLEFRFQRVAPIYVSSHNPEVVYHASQYLHKTTDDGLSWEIISPDLTAFEPDKQVISGHPITRDVTGEEYYSTIYSIRESKLKEGLIWVGANDGPVHITEDGGVNWKNVTPSDLPKGGRVDCVEPSSHKEGKAYIAVLRYQLGDWHPYIYKTENFGENWILLTNGKNGLPENYPTRVVREDPKVEGLLYAGTEFGIFVSFDDGLNWQSLQQNLPITPITDIKIFRDDLILSTMGRSFWIMDNISPLRFYEKLQQTTSNYLAKPMDVIRYRFRPTGSNTIPYYPGSAVVIDYYLNKEANEDIRIEILDADKNLIKSFSSTNGANKDEEKNIEYSWFYIRSSKLLLSNEIGAHRIKWDMKHRGSWDANPVRSFDFGPNVAPGNYYVLLKVDGEEYLQSFKILPDPKLKNIGIINNDLIEQESLSLKLIKLSSRAKQLIYEIKIRREEIAKIMEGKGPRKKLRKEDEKLGMLEKKLVMDKGRYMTPKLNDQINFLIRTVNRADQKPSKNMLTQFKKLSLELEEFENEFESI